MRDKANNLIDKNNVSDYMYTLIDELEAHIHENMPRKSLLPPLKGKAWEEGKIGTNEIKQAIKKLSVDDESEFLVQGIVFGCLMLGKDAAQHSTIARAKEIMAPYREKERKQFRINKSKEFFFKDECLKIAELTWNKYPKASISSLANKLHDYFSNVKGLDVSYNTIEKNWLAKATFKPKFKSDRTLDYHLVFE